VFSDLLRIEPENIRLLIDEDVEEINKVLKEFFDIATEFAKAGSETPIPLTSPKYG